MEKVLCNILEIFKIKIDEMKMSILQSNKKKQKLKIYFQIIKNLKISK